MEKHELLRENAVAMFFLMKHSLLGASKFDSEYKDTFIKAGKLFFDMLAGGEITEEKLNQLQELKEDSLTELFLVTHEFGQENDDEILRTEHRLLSLEYEKIQRKEDEEQFPPINFSELMVEKNV